MYALIDYPNIDRAGQFSALSAGITNASTAIPVYDQSKFYVGCVIRIDSEDMVVTAIPAAPNLTCSRAYNGTSAVAHSQDAPVTITGVAMNQLGSTIYLPDLWLMEKRDIAGMVCELEGGWANLAGADASNNMVAFARGTGRRDTRTVNTIFNATNTPQIIGVKSGADSAGSSTMQLVGASPAASGRFWAEFYMPLFTPSSTVGCAIGKLPPLTCFVLSKLAGAAITAGTLNIERLTVYTQQKPY